jgi:hypothetical protein
MHGLECVAAQNEDDAVTKAHGEFRAIVADIELSEAGGDERGGLLLAERLAKEGSRVPVIVISYNVRRWLPAKDSPEYGDTVKRLGVHAVLDRNSERFRQELVDCLTTTRAR